MRLYRLFPWLASAAEGEPGHALYVPEPSGAGRADNPSRYGTLYFSDAPAGAVAEAFGGLKIWIARMFVRPDLPRSVRALATYDSSRDLRIFDLDNADALKSLGLRPSQVVTREREVTQRWALAIYEEGKWGGVRWWSYYDPRWYSYAIWDTEALASRLVAVQPLTLDSAAVAEAAEILGRPRK